MKRSTLFIGLSLFASAATMQAQSQGTAPAPAPGLGRIVGRVVDPRGRGIVDASVETENRPAASVRSDSTGHFTVVGLNEGVYTVTVRRIGYGPKQAKVTASKMHSVDVLFVLEKSAQELAGVTIETRPLVPLEYRYTHRFDQFFENRHANMGGVFYTKDDIESLGGFSAAMNRIPGTQMRYGQYGRLVVNMDRCASERIAYIINDIAVTDGLMSIIPEQIQTLEVYQGINSMPAKARGNACAAIVIQTK